MFVLLIYFGISFAGVIRLSHGYNEFQKCNDPYIRIFDTYPFQADIKTSVDPCTDFYEYVCGNWQINNPNPGGYEKWSTLKKIQHETYRRIHELLITENEYDKSPIIKIAKQYHRSCMDEEAIENEGLKPMKLLLKETGEWPILNRQGYKENYTWQNTYNTYNKLHGLSNIFSLVYRQDERDKTRNVFLIYSSLANEQLSKETCRHVNVDTMIKVVRAFAADEKIYIPIENLRADVFEIIMFETNLRKLSSKESMTKVTRMTIAELQEFYDSFTKTQNSSAKINWLDMIQSSFKDINVIIDASESVLVNKEFFREMALLLDVTPPRIIVNYVQWNIVCRVMKYLNKQMRNIEFEYHTNYNVAQREPRWLKCLQDEWIQHFLSYLYVKAYFQADILKAVLEMTDKIKAEIKKRISLLPLVSRNTKKQMMNRLDKVSSYIGYPKWYDNQTTFMERYKGFKLGKNYFANRLAIAKYERKRTMIDETVDRKDSKNTDIWPMFPIEVAAMYSINEKAIVIPAAIMQNPFFTSNRPSALNYGALGFIIGHELTHSLTDSRFMNKIRGLKCLIDYYNNITLGVTLDVTNFDGKSPISYGEITLIENVADIIGAQTAFAAFQKNEAKATIQWISKNATNEQLFFTSLVNVMCTSAIETDIISDHGFNNFRMIGSLSNMQSFVEAFKCTVGSPMNPESKCKL